jgi:hypothetical protein
MTARFHRIRPKTGGHRPPYKRDEDNEEESENASVFHCAFQWSVPS